jgi:hypothetical protein
VVTAQVFHHLNKDTNIYIYINMYFIAALRGKIKRERERKRKSDGADDLKLRA